VRWIVCRVKGQRFDGFDRPAAPTAAFYTGATAVEGPDGSGRRRDSEREVFTDGEGVVRSEVAVKGKFF